MQLNMNIANTRRPAPAVQKIETMLIERLRKANARLRGDVASAEKRVVQSESVARKSAEDLVRVTGELDRAKKTISELKEKLSTVSQKLERESRKHKDSIRTQPEAVKGETVA